ncbi:MAG: glycosyltransferase [Clostridia bacterium]|nr:glycosyltransferase [Clostridia bacterium]
MAKSPVEVSFVIPTLAKTGYYRRCVHTLLGACLLPGKRTYEIIIVDDGSPREYQEELLKDCRAMGCRAHLRRITGGFTRAVNEGLYLTRGKYLFLVNDDVEFFQPQWLELMVRVSEESPRAGITGCRLLYPNGLIQHGGMDYCGVGSYLLSHRYVNQDREFLPAKANNRVIAVTGAVMMIKRGLVEDMGYMDEGFRITCSDTDYCLRAQQRGWGVYYCGEAEAIHHEGKTRGNTPENKDPAWYKLEIRDNERFYQRWQEAIHPLLHRL